MGKKYDLTNSCLQPTGLYGSLYVVGTPIGNLEDVTLRAIRILKEAHYILCEDKRITQKLLNKYQIKTRLISFHKFNEAKTEDEVISLIKSGKSIALLSDAGTPLISDPGARLIKKLNTSGFKVISIPGVSALTAAVSVFGIEGEFLFVGFLPSKKSQRDKILSDLKNRSKNVILFISPHDLKKYVKEIYELYPNVKIYFARELTKIYEEIWSGNVQEFVQKIENSPNTKLKGEMVLGLSFEENRNVTHMNTNECIKLLNKYIKSGKSLKEASKELAKETNLSSSYLYNLFVKEKRG